jgi:general secretion pathway protein J
VTKRRAPRRHCGFTLVEILVAMAIAAILATMAFSAMNEAMQNRQRIRQAQERLVGLQFMMRSLVQDFSQLVPRPVRMPIGEDFEAAVLGRSGASAEVVLTRAGWTNPAGLSRSSLQRVRYQVRDGVLYRDYWLALDVQLEPEPVQRALIDGVEAFTIRYMNDGRQWQDNWPPPQPNAGDQLRYKRWRPIAVEITLRLRDWGTITRIVEVPA